ncbi:hypothetical protein [Pseudomonas sp. RA_35y_Pfl2_P32]|uniref:hypothetical protein n=1 Tax=Pseudomonas sp. RA_35y_Pfl2_P32 TaxID=3088705 RepID=UPI0030D7D6BC
MQSPKRISLVLRAPEGKTLEQILQFAQLGAHVSIGRGLAVIAGASDRDLVTPAIEVPEFCIDEHIQMVADANRYRWLRDGALSTGSANVPMVCIGMGEPVGGADLDLVTDAAALNWPMVDEFANEVQA